MYAQSKVNRCFQREKSKKKNATDNNHFLVFLVTHNFREKSSCLKFLVGS